MRNSEQRAAIHIKRNVEAALIVVCNSASQALDPARGGIAIYVRTARCLAQFVDDMLRRRHVWIAHAEINDIRALRAKRRLGAVYLFKDVRRKSADLVEVCIHLLAARRPLVTRGTSKADRMASISSSVRNSELA